ncbi:MAG: YbjN domain-containing protein [Rhodospirillaceae bacterium]
MTSLSTAREAVAHHPIDIVEQLVEFNEWTFDRRNNEEMAVQVPGSWCDYSLYFAWNEEMEAIHFTCAFDMRVAEDQMARVFELLALVNEKLWLGHFSIWADEGLPMFRATLALRGQQGLTVEQTEDLVETALTECERFFPAFQYVIWGGKTATDAIEAAMIDTVGEA